MLLVYHTFSSCCRSRAKSITIIHCPDYSFILLKEAIYLCIVPYHNSYSSSRLVHCYMTLPQASKPLFTHRFRTHLALASVSAEGWTESLQSEWTALERKGWMPWRFRRGIWKHLFLFSNCWFVCFPFSCYFHTLIMSLTFTLILVFLQSEDYIAKQHVNGLLRHYCWTYKTWSIFLLVQLGSDCKQGFECPRTAVESEGRPEKCDSKWRQISCLISWFNSSCQSLKGKEATENNIHEVIRKQKS